MLRGQDATEPNTTMAAWTRDLFTGRHPTFTPDQATVVEHRPSGTIVSSALLVSQILFGFRSLEELEAAFPDCLVRTADPGTKRPAAARYFLLGRPGRPYWASTTLAADFLPAPGGSIENAANLALLGP